EEAERRTGDRGAEDRHARAVVLGQDEEWERHRQEQDQPAHGRRARLHRVTRGALLADVLPELAPAQELDELRPQEDADEQRGHPRDEDASHHYRAPITRSRPADREPLISTRSPGCASSSRIARASSGLATACFS